MNLFAKEHIVNSTLSFFRHGTWTGRRDTWWSSLRTTRMSSSRFYYWQLPFSFLQKDFHVSVRSVCQRTARWSTSSSAVTSSSQWEARRATSNSTRSSSTNWPGAGLDPPHPHLWLDHQLCHQDQLVQVIIFLKLIFQFFYWSASPWTYLVSPWPLLINLISSVVLVVLIKSTKDWAWLTWPTWSTSPIWPCATLWESAVTVTFSVKEVKNPSCKKKQDWRHLLVLAWGWKCQKCINTNWKCFLCRGLSCAFPHLCNSEFLLCCKHQGSKVSKFEISN